MTRSDPAASHPSALDPDELLRACDETRTKRSGPGGQHRNKTQTAVILVHQPTGISAEGSERRSQAENRRAALKRLRLKLALELRTPGAPSGPSELWRSRTRGGRLRVSAEHQDYPALIAEALDQLNQTGWRMSAAAATLGVTTTQLTGLFKKNPAARVAVNTHRAALGLPALQ